MDFNMSNLELVLKEIEKHLHFHGDNLSEPHDWDLELKMKVQDIIDKSPNEAEKIRYTIKTLELLGYIKLSQGNCSFIDSVTPMGLKLIFEKNHNIKFD